MVVRDQKAMDLQQFVIDFFQQLGALVELPSYSLVEVIIPDDYSPYFEGESFLRLSFDPEVAEEEEAAFITHGSPLLDTITDLILQEVKMLKRHINLSSPLLPDNIEERIKSQITFQKSRPPEFISSEIREHHFLEVIFLLSLISDEREEKLEGVVVDLNRGCIARGMESRINQALFEQKRAQLYPLSRVITMGQALLLARDEVDRRAAVHNKRFMKRIASFKERELDKIRGFYWRTEQELRERMEALNGKEGAEKRLENLQQKLRANTIDRERRIADIEDKYSSQVEIEVDSLILYSLPRFRVEFSVQQRDKRYRHQLLYNPLLQQIDPPVCSKCQSSLPDSYWIEGEFFCPQCL